MTQQKTFDESDSIGIKSIEILANSNATEDVLKVRKCIENLIPNIELNQIQEINVMGGYNNPIKILKSITNNIKDINYFLETLSTRLEIKDKKELTKQFYSRLNNNGAFYLRLRKDSLSLKKFVLSKKSDVLRITIVFFNKKTKSQKKNDPNNIKKYLLLKNILTDI